VKEETRSRDDGASLCDDSDLNVPLVKFNYLDNMPIHGFLKLGNDNDDNQIKSIYSKMFNCK
jgi:hypothetical protein